MPYKPRRHLRSEANGLLDEPRTRLKFGDRAFSISAPRLWNALPTTPEGFYIVSGLQEVSQNTPFQCSPIEAFCGLLLKTMTVQALLKTFYEWKRRYIKFQLLLFYYYIWVFFTGI